MARSYKNTWNDLIDHVTGIELGKFVVMPNPIHGIIAIVGAGSKPALRPPISQQPLPEIPRTREDALPRQRR